MNHTNVLRIRKSRLFLLASVVAYVAVFNVTYEMFVAPTYISWGLSYRPLPFAYTVGSWVLCLLPALWLPLVPRRPSQLLFYIQYFVLYIPAVFVIYHSSRPELPVADAFLLSVLMFAGLSVIQFIYYVPLAKVEYKRLPPSYFWCFFLLLSTFLIGYTLALLGHNFRLANLEEIYDVRSAAAEIVEQTGSRLGFYAQTWLAGFVLPFCFAAGAFARRWWIVAVAGAGYLLLFGIGGSKTTLFSFIFLPLVYLWVRRMNRYSSSWFAWGLLFLLLGGPLLNVAGLRGLAYWYIAVVNFRTFSVPALAIAQYYEFFQQNPYTYMSHVKGFSLLVPFPYEGDLPQIIGQYFYGAPVGLNAGLWAGDGLTAFGPMGIIVVSAICAAIFWVFDSVCSRYDPRFVMVAMAFIATSFANVSLFTTILSGGFAFLVVALIVLPKRGVLQCALKLPMSAEVILPYRPGNR